MKSHESSVVTATDENSDDSGICKKPNPYFPDDYTNKEDWMQKTKLTGKYKDMLSGIELYGLNPGNVVSDKDILRIDTELPGGELAARECFKNLTDGIEPPLVISAKHYKFTKLDGTVITFRPLGDSGHPKVEINGKLSNKIHEKITFK